MFRSLSLAGLFSLTLAVTNAGLVKDWNRPQPPFQIADQVYYVGTNALASYLITTPAGNILVNPDFEESVPLIAKSVSAVGMRFSDIKIILISHAHDDHAAGCAFAKKLSGGQLMVMAQDAPLIETGGVHDFAYHERWAPAKVDRLLHDGDHVTLGGITLVAHLTPGHTRGCTTWTANVTDHGHIRHMVIIGSPNVNPGYRLVNNRVYPNISEDYEMTFRVLHSLPCDLFLGAHPSYFGMEDKLKKLKPNGPNPFVDPAGYQAYVNRTEQAFQQELAKQEAGK